MCDIVLSSFLTGMLWTPPGLWGVKMLSLGVKMSKFQVTPVEQYGPPTDPEHAPYAAKLAFPAPGRPAMAGAGPGMALVPFMADRWGDLKGAKGALKTPPAVNWEMCGPPLCGPPPPGVPGGSKFGPWG